ncbi:MAG: trimeric autotransporter adhesin, partial [Mycobacterium sp.]|nr:trimeric autotransporter adhesin [Mycobacterium sp.]
SDGALTTAASSSVVITVGAAAKVAFTTQPSSSTGGVAFATQPVVTVQDLGGNTVVGNTSAVTLTLTVAGSGSLTCTTNPQAAVAGVATFAGCKIDVASTYTLTATDGSLTTAASGSVVITTGAAAMLRYLQQPVGSTAGTNFPTQPQVRITDLGGNTVTTNTSSVTLTLVGGSGVLTCTLNPEVAVAGITSFSGCKISLAGSYTINATDGALTAITSNTVTIV